MSSVVKCPERRGFAIVYAHGWAAGNTRNRRGAVAPSASHHHPQRDPVATADGQGPQVELSFRLRVFL